MPSATPANLNLALGTRLVRAREASGLLLDFLAREARVPAPALSAHERGEAMLSVGQIGRVARVLDIRSGPLMDLGAPEDLPSRAPEALLLARTGELLTAEDQVEVGRGLRRARSFAALRTILGKREHDRLFTFSAPPEEKPYLSGYERARLIRHAIGETSKPILNLGRLLEDELGILICSAKFGSKDLLAASCRSGVAKVIVLNDNAAMSRKAVRRKALAHELGHLALDSFQGEGAVADVSDRPFDASRPPVEKRAEAFAFMLLAPDTGIRDLLGPPLNRSSGGAATKAIAKVQAHFGVPREAAGWHLYALRYLESEVEVRAAAAGAPKDNLLNFETAPPRDALRELAVEAVRQERISPAKAREFLNLGANVDL